ncbi:hypothetical protein [Streptomyces sp. NPDC004296]|uniref:hypothetical protein n=1 Tax=Streptomyces sp. NPDC004296 TaxID=3364697 RepID=UPI0036B63BDD
MTRTGRTETGLAVPGIWCERTVYRSVHADEVASWTSLAVATPLRAVREIAADARRLAAGLSGRARERALREVDGDGCLGAVSALHRGEPCGLTLNCAGTWVEWSAHPVLFLPVVSRTGPRRCRGDGGAEGFGVGAVGVPR